MVNRTSRSYVDRSSPGWGGFLPFSGRKYVKPTRRAHRPAGRWSRPPPPPPRSPGWSPSTGRRSRGAAPSPRAGARPARAGAKSRARASSGRSANGGIVMSPANTTASACDVRSTKASTCFERHAVLALLARDVHLQQHAHRLLGVALDLLDDRLALDRVDQPHAREHLLGLAALEVADEVPRERVAPALLLCDQRLGRVLADDLHAGLRKRAHQLERHVLGRGQDLDVRGSRPAARAGLVDPRLRLGEALAHTPRDRPALGGEPSERGLPAGDAAVAAVGEEQLLVAADADPGDRDVVDACAPQVRLRRRPEDRACRPSSYGPAPARRSMTSGPTS